MTSLKFGTIAFQLGNMVTRSKSSVRTSVAPSSFQHLISAGTIWFQPVPPSNKVSFSKSEGSTERKFLPHALETHIDKWLDLRATLSPTIQSKSMRPHNGLPQSPFPNKCKHLELLPVLLKVQSSKPPHFYTRMESLQNCVNYK